VSASYPSINCDRGTGGQVIADPRDNPFPECTPPKQGGRHHQNGGRHQNGTLGASTSEPWAVSDWNRWATYVGIRSRCLWRTIGMLATYGPTGASIKAEFAEAFALPLQSLVVPDAMAALRQVGRLARPLHSNSS